MTAAYHSSNDLLTQVCPQCGSVGVIVDSRIIYGRPYGYTMTCANYPDCDTYVGCHADGYPKGYMADAETRMWRVNAHNAFDALWDNVKSRLYWYGRLAQYLEIDMSDCHIAMFNVDQCKRVIQFAQEVTDANNEN